MNNGQKKTKCIIFQHSLSKLIFDIVICALLLCVCCIVPYRICFIDKDSTAVKYTFIFVDFCFFIDMIVTFFTTITDEEEMKEITNKKKIAKAYMMGWFWVDAISIFPFDDVSKLL